MKLDLNLDLLKFHSFKMNNVTHNLTNFKTENFNEFEKKIFSKDRKSLSYVINYELMEQNKGNHKHKIKGINREKLINIIEKKHENLYSDLLQKSEDDLLNLNFYSCKIGKKERLIYMIKDEVFYPILFDLNHVIYEDKNKNHDNNIGRKNINVWDFRNEQEKCKDEIYNKLKNNIVINYNHSK